MSAPKRIWVWQDYDGTWLAHSETLQPYRLPDAEYVRAELCDPMQDERVKRLKAENARLRGELLRYAAWMMKCLDVSDDLRAALRDVEGG